MKKEFLLEVFICILFLLTVILGVFAIFVLQRDMVLFFIAMLCALFGNILNLIRILLKRKK